MSARSIGSGTIHWSMLAIPFRRYTATRERGIELNLLHEPCGSRPKQQLWCPLCEAQIEHSSCVKGYEIAPGQYVRFTREELASIWDAPPDLSIVSFIPFAKVDPLFFKRAYYIGPDKGGADGYALLEERLRKRSRVAKCTFAMRGKQTNAVIRPASNGRLIVHELYKANEICAVDEVPLGEPKPAPRQAAELADWLMKRQSQEAFEPDGEDIAAKVFLEAVEKKKAGLPVEVPQPEPQIIDIVEALKRSNAKIAAENEKLAAEVEALRADSKPEPSAIVSKGPKKAEPRKREAPKRRREK